MYLGLQNTRNIYQTNAYKMRRGENIPCSRRSMDQIQLSKVKLLDSRDWAIRGEQKPKNEEEMKGASARETLAWVLNPRSASRSMALTYLPRQRHLGWPAVSGQASQRQGLRRYRPRRRPLESKDQFTSSRG